MCLHLFSLFKANILRNPWPYIFSFEFILLLFYVSIVTIWVFQLSTPNSTFLLFLLLLMASKSDHLIICTEFAVHKELQECIFLIHLNMFHDWADWHLVRWTSDKRVWLLANSSKMPSLGVNKFQNSLGTYTIVLLPGVTYCTNFFDDSTSLLPSIWDFISLFWFFLRYRFVNFWHNFCFILLCVCMRELISLFNSGILLIVSWSPFRFKRQL